MNQTEIEEEPHYLLDSNIVSELVKPRASFSVLKKLSEHISDWAICAPVWEELLFGLHCLDEGSNKTYLEKFIKNEVQEEFPIKNYTKRAAEIHAELRAKLKRLGKPTQSSDSMIAAIALANHMVLVTRNTRHFAAIQEVSDLEVENWFDESENPEESG